MPKSGVSARQKYFTTRDKLVNHDSLLTDAVQYANIFSR